MATITLPKNKDAPLPPAVTAAIEAELQRRGVLPKPKQAWDPKDNPAGWNDIGSLRGAARQLWQSKEFLCIISGPSECVAGETRLYNPETGEHTPIEELYRKQIAPVAMTMEGPAQAEVPFVKGIARLYRVTMKNGHSFLATAQHLVLTDRGWTFVSDLACGDVVPSCLPNLLPSNSEPCLLKSPQGVRHSSHRRTNWQDRYSTYRRRDDEPLLLLGDSDRELPPLRRGVLAHNHADCSEDGSNLSASHIRLQCADRLSTGHYSAKWDEKAYGGFGALADRLSQSFPSSQYAVLSQIDSGLLLQDCVLVQGSDHKHLDNGSFALLHNVLSNTSLFAEEDRTHPPSIGWTDLQHKAQGCFALAQGIKGDNFSFNTSCIAYERALQEVPQNTVVSIEFEREDTFYDLHVPGAEHYLAEGVWHHNTGKTFASLKKVNALLWKYPGAQWVMLRKTYSSAIATCLMTYKRIIGENSPIKAYGGEKPEWFDYPNGSRLWIGGLDNLAKVLSGERDGYYINQAEELELSEIETITTRATGRGSVMPYTQIIADANPGPPSHWIVTRDNVTLLKSYHEDNPTLFQFAPEGAQQGEEWPDTAYNGRVGRWTPQGRRTLSILQNLTGMRRARLYLGQWVQAEGVVYETFDRNIHTVPSFEIPKEWRRIRVIDFGYENPFVCLWAAIDPDGRIYIYREIYLTHVLVSEIARDIRKLSAGETIEATICDHDAEDRATLAAEGIRSIPAYKKVSPGIQKVQDYLKVAGDGRPRLMILRDAQDQAPLTFPLQQPDAELLEKKKPTRTAEEFEFYVWEKDMSGKPNKEVPVKEFDHGMDNCRYACAYVSGLAKRRGRAY